VVEVDASRLAVGCHPAVDELDERYVVFATSSPTVRLNEPFAAFVGEALVRGVRPVLVTTTTARVSPFVSLMMAQVGGVWGVQTRDCAMFDAMSGYRVSALGDLCGEPTVGAERLPGFTDPPTAPVRVVTFDVHTHQRAEPSSRVGAVADVVGGCLGARWECWSTREPLLQVWDVAALTREAQRSMPESHTYRVVGSDGAFVQVQAARTRIGLLERTWGGVPVSDDDDVLALAEGVAEALVGVHNPTVAFVSLAQYDRDRETGAVVQAVRKRPVEAPVAVLVGARAVRDLGVDLDGLVRGHDVRTLGRAKVPCLLVRFDGASGEQRWTQVARFAQVLGPEAIRRALGVNG
jgi:hypothetical protein